MFTNFPNGVTSFGIPALGGNPWVGIPKMDTGKVVFVDPLGLTGANFGNGGTYTTVQAGVNALNDNDTLFIFPGTYAENVVISEVNYVSIVGATVPGYGRPDIAPTTGVAIVITQSQGVTLKGIRAVSEDADSVQCDSNGFWFDDCVFDGTAGQAATEGNLRLVGLSSDDSFSASEGRISNTLLRGSGGAGIIFQHANAPSGIGVSDVEVLGCRFYGNGVDLLSATNTSGGGAGIFTRLSVMGNRFMTVGAAYVYANMDQGVAGDLAANSALICGNYFADEALIAAQFAVGGQPNVMVVGNYDAAGLVNGTTFND